MVTERNKVFKLWSIRSLHSLFLKNTSYKCPNIYDVRRDRGWEGLEICRVLTYFIVFKHQNYGSFLRIRVRGWGEGVGCGRHNCLIPNIKTYFDKEVTLLVQEWHQNMRNCKSLFKQTLPLEKKQKPGKNDHIWLVAVL